MKELKQIQKESSNHSDRHFSPFKELKKYIDVDFLSNQDSKNLDQSNVFLENIKLSFNFYNISSDISYRSFKQGFSKFPIILDSKNRYISLYESNLLLKEDLFVWSPYLLEYYTEFDFKTNPKQLRDILAYSGVYYFKSDCPEDYIDLSREFKEFIDYIYIEVFENVDTSFHEYYLKKIIRWFNQASYSNFYKNLTLQHIKALKNNQ